MAKQIGVNLKEARLIQQWLNSNVSSATRSDMVAFVKDDAKVITKVIKELESSELYNKVGGEIEKEAQRIVNEKCVPEWNRISEEMKPLGEEVNKLSKEKAENKEWNEEKENKLAELNKKLADLTNDYQKVTDEANAELNEFKEKRIGDEQGACFFLTEKEYKIIGKYAGF